MALAVVAALFVSVGRADGAPLSWSSPTLIDHHSLLGVSCPSASLCVAVDKAGDVVTSTNPAGGAGGWTVAQVDASYNYVEGVSCPSVSLCVAVDISGDVITSTNPTGGAGAWTVANVDGLNIFRGVSCPSTSLCVAVDEEGDVVTSTNPTGGTGAWTVAHVDGSNVVYSVSCPSVSLCVAGDVSGDVVTSTNPTGGIGAWTVAHLESANNVVAGVSCPSASLCVGMGNGFVVSSTNPTGGAGTWTLAPVGEVFGLVDSVSCPSASMCVGVDGTGDVVASIDPTGRYPGAWAVTNVDGARHLSGVSCPSASLCVAVDEAGNELSSTLIPPTPPAVTTGAATNVTFDSATLNASVNPEGLYTEWAFAFGTTTAYDHTIGPGVAGSGTTTLAESVFTLRTAPLLILTPNTTYHYAVFAANAVGETMGSDQTFTTGPPPTPPLPPRPPPTSAPYRSPTGPTITSLTQTASIWREGSKLAQISARTRPPIGTVFSFDLNEQASVTLNFTQRSAGRRLRGKCVAQSPTNKRTPRCTRAIVAGTLAFTAHQGANKVHFEGLLSRTRKLKPGRYTLVITAITPGVGSTSKTLTFAIVK